MRYAIGVEIEDKKSQNNYHGRDAIGRYERRFVFTSVCNADIHGCTIDIYADIEEAKKKVGSLTKSYRYDDSIVRLNKLLGRRQKQKKKSKKIRRFYLLKVDSPRFPVILKDINRFGEKRKNVDAYLFFDKYGG